MKQAILTKFLPPTDTKGARIKAWCLGGEWTGRLAGSHENVAGAHLTAALQLAIKLDWTVDNWQGGALPDGSGYCFVQCETVQS